MTYCWKIPRTWIPEAESVNYLHQIQSTGIDSFFLRQYDNSYIIIYEEKDLFILGTAS